jgi:hypothetical protein
MQVTMLVLCLAGLSDLHASGLTLMLAGLGRLLLQMCWGCICRLMVRGRLPTGLAVAGCLAAGLLAGLLGWASGWEGECLAKVAGLVELLALAWSLSSLLLVRNEVRVIRTILGRERLPCMGALWKAKGRELQDRVRYLTGNGLASVACSAYYLARDFYFSSERGLCLG